MSASISLRPCRDEDLSSAWVFAQRHPRLHHDTEDGLRAFARQGNVSAWGIWTGRLEAVLLIEQVSRDTYGFHVYPRHRPDRAVIRTAAYEFGGCLFREREAQVLEVRIDHRNRAAKWLAEACGMRETGEREGKWVRFAITREEFYGQENNHTDQHLRLENAA